MLCNSKKKKKEIRKNSEFAWIDPWKNLWENCHAEPEKTSESENDGIFFAVMDHQRKILFFLSKKLHPHRVAQDFKTLRN